MPVNTECSRYIDNTSQWKTVRDVVAGEIVIKKAKTDYLPKPAGQSGEDYKNYQARVHFFDATCRTADGLHGNIFSRDPVQYGEVNEAFTDMLKNVDTSGTSIDQFAADITWDAMQTCWGGIMIDYTDVPIGAPLASARGAAYLKWYNAESAINWRYGIINGRKQLVMVVLRENKYIIEADEFVEKPYLQYRVLSFDENGNYIQRLYSELDGYQTYQLIEQRMAGVPLKHIPFIPVPGDNPDKSMLLGLAFENIGHYQKTADYENGLHFSGLPSPFCLNMDAPEDENGNPKGIHVGSTEFNFFNNRDDPNKHVDVKYLEFSGAGLEKIHEALNACEERMAILGARIISVEKKGVETAEAARIHRAGENSVLGAFARNMSECIIKAVRIMAVWNGVSEEMAEQWSYELNTDYDEVQAGAQIVSAILGGAANGLVPQIAVYNVLKRAAIVPESMSYEDYVIELSAGSGSTHEEEA